MTGSRDRPDGYGRIACSIDTASIATVSAWLDDNIDGRRRAVRRSTLIAGGRSNLTFTVTDADGRRFVLRRPAARRTCWPPPTTWPASTGSSPPSARPTCRCRRRSACAPTTTVNGAPFYVMGFVDGVVLDSAEQGASSMPVELRRPASEHLIDVLADLHAVDVDAVGLGDLAKRERLHRAPGASAGRRSGRTPRPASCRRSTRSPSGSRERMPEQQGVVDRPRRLPLRQLPHRRRRRAASPPCSTGSCARSATRSPTSATSACTGPTGDRHGRAQRPDRRRRVPDLRRAARALRRRAPGRDLSAASTTTSRSRRWRLAVISEGVYARYLHGAMGDQRARRTGAQRIQGRRPTRSPNRRSRRCGGWRERQRPRCWPAGNAGSFTAAGHHPRRRSARGTRSRRRRRARDPRDHPEGHPVRRRGGRRRVHRGDAVAASARRARSRARLYVARSIAARCASPASSRHWALQQTSPIIAWLRALARNLHAERRRARASGRSGCASPAGSRSG